MELALYKALISLKIEEALVINVINAMEVHFEDRVTRATVPVLAKLESQNVRLDAIKVSQEVRLDAMKGEVLARIDALARINDQKSQLGRWALGSAIGGSTATLAVLKAFGII